MPALHWARAHRPAHAAGATQRCFAGHFPASRRLVRRHGRVLHWANLGPAQTGAHAQSRQKLGGRGGLGGREPGGSRDFARVGVAPAAVRFSGHGISAVGYRDALLSRPGMVLADARGDCERSRTSG